MKYRLKELLKEKNGYIRGPFGSALKRSELLKLGIPVYEQANAINNHRVFRYFIGNKKYEELARFTVQKNDLLISCSGTVGKITIIKENDPIGIISQALLILRPNEEKILPMFLYYFFESKEGYNSIISRSSGSVQVNIAKRSVIEEIEIELPDLKTQESIVEALALIDGKIKINIQINKKLEELAQSIFKQWFVDFEFPNEDGEPYKSSGGEMIESEIGMIPKGWVVNRFSDFVESISNSINKKEKKQAIFLNTSDILDGEILHNNYSNVNEMPGQAKKTIRKNDILFSEIRPANKRFAYIGFESEDYVVSTKLMVLRTNENSFSSKCVYLFLKNPNTLMELQHKAESRSGTFPQITFKELANYKFAIPKKDKFNKYYDVLEKLVDQQIMIKDENKKLILLRDTLLPKLMSGEIRVPIES